MTTTSYLIALGSNRRGRHGSPERELAAALEELSALGTVSARAPIVRTAPLGAAQRRFANAAALLDTDLAPPALLAQLKAIERAFGRRRGRRWGDRVLDLDIILWSGGAWAGDSLTVPHPGYRTRGFVLTPAARIAANWRDPLTGRTVRHEHARLLRRG